MGKRRQKKDFLDGWWWISLALVGVMLMVWSVWQKGKDEVVVEYVEIEEETERWYWVDVGGAVERPGVYQVVSGSRLKDALIAAGGLADEADRDYVSRMINLAGEVSDEEKVYIPFREEKGEGEVVVEAGEGLVNLNTASKDELDTLWGVGEKRAEEIIASRPYKSMEEVVEKGVLPASVMEKNKEKVTVY